jgi:hypothetical protein
MPASERSGKQQKQQPRSPTIVRLYYCRLLEWPECDRAHWCTMKEGRKDGWMVSGQETLFSVGFQSTN